MGIYTTGPVVGGILALSLTNSVAMPALDQDWPAVLQLYAGVTLVVAMLWFAIGRNEGRADRGGFGVPLWMLFGICSVLTLLAFLAARNPPEK